MNMFYHFKRRVTKLVPVLVTDMWGQKHTHPACSSVVTADGYLKLHVNDSVIATYAPGSWAYIRVLEGEKPNA